MMNYEQYKNLKQEVKSKDFFTNYKGLSKILYKFSYVANGFSILFAYFHISKMINQAIANPSKWTWIAMIVVSIMILTGLEYFKRYIFDKFSFSFIKEKFKFKGTEISILAIASIFFISLSFYLSLNGAREFAAKSDEIKQTTEITVQSYEDSINTVYERKINDIDSSSNFLSKQKLDYEDKSENSESLRDKKYYREQIKNNQILIDKNEIKIKNLKNERDAELAKKTDKIKTKADETINTNQANSMRFLFFSTIIEFFIIIGIYFKNFYSQKSVTEYETISSKDPKYKTFNQYNILLDVLYTGDVKIGDPIPYKAQLSKIMKMTNSDLSGKELEDTTRMLSHLNILQKKGNKRIIKVDKEAAQIKIKEYLKID